MENDSLSDKIDPEIASLLGGEVSSGSPNFQDLFEEKPKKKSEQISYAAFSSIKRFEQESDPLFSTKDFYQNLLKGTGEIAPKIHKALQLFLKCDDNEKIGVYRQRLIPLYWDLCRVLSTTYNKEDKPKRSALRYGLLLPTLISPEQRDMLSRVIFKKEVSEPIHYLDEWLDLVSQGRVNPLASDELKASQMNTKSKIGMQIEKTKGTKDSALTILSSLTIKRDTMELSLQNKVKSLMFHDTHSSFPEIKLPYNSVQKGEISQINGLLRDLTAVNKEIKINVDQLSEAQRNLTRLDKKFDGTEPVVDKGILQKEVDNFRQMHKMCVGRQGNHFPFLLKKFFFSQLNLMGTRENIIQVMTEIEKVDPQVFHRTFKNKTNRIVPHTIIIPCYGEKGICWEPFERYNRATSPGRIAIPMYPKDLKLAVIYAMGDLRWHVAKERAQHYWMEEGITGHYYQWFNSQKLRGDVRLRFLEDYVLWITKESLGVQKLDKEVRAIFWRYAPFPEELKKNLRNQGFVYNNLYKKDINRSLSDGY